MYVFTSYLRRHKPGDGSPRAGRETTYRMQPNPTAATTTTTHTAYIWHSLGTGCDTSCLTLRVKPTQRVPCQPRWIPEQTPPTLPWVSRSLLSLARRASASLSESKPPARTTQDAPKFPRTRGSHHCLHHHRSHHLPPATTIRRSKQYKRSDVEMRQRNPAGPNIAHRATSRRTAYCPTGLCPHPAARLGSSCTAE